MSSVTITFKLLWHHLCNFLLYSVHCSNSCVQRLQNASDIQALVRDSRNQLVAPVRQLSLFPNITFTCTGSIVGWRLAAIDSIRSGRPELSVWRLSGVNQYTKVTGQHIDSCTVAESMRTLDTCTVMIHENTLDPPIPFEAGCFRYTFTGLRSSVHVHCCTMLPDLVTLYSNCM